MLVCFIVLLFFWGGLERWHHNRAEHCFPCCFPRQITAHSLAKRFLNCDVSREREFQQYRCYVLSLCYPAVHSVLTSAATLALLWCSDACTDIASRDNDKCTVHINNNYSITVILHTRNTAGCFPCSKCCSSFMPWFTLFLPHFQLCHLIMNAKKSWLAVGDCESTGTCVPDSLRMQGSAGCFSEQRLQDYRWQQEAGLSWWRWREKSVLDIVFVFGLRGNGGSVGKQETTEPQRQPYPKKAVKF